MKLSIDREWIPYDVTLPKIYEYEFYEYEFEFVVKEIDQSCSVHILCINDKPLQNHPND